MFKGHDWFIFLVSLVRAVFVTESIYHSSSNKVLLLSSAKLDPYTVAVSFCTGYLKLTGHSSEIAARNPKFHQRTLCDKKELKRLFS